MDFLSEIMDWENGYMDPDQEVHLFQRLIDCGMAWTMQGSYGRRALELIREGLCSDPGNNYRG